jgi:hypothetical protein
VQVLSSSDPVGAIIEIYRQKDNVSLSRLAVIQALLSHGIITHAQYMNFMYMKSVMLPFKRENEGSVIAEVGSEHCHSDGHITDTEEGEAREETQSDAEAEINLLKQCLIRQVGAHQHSTSVADPGCLSRILDLTFFHSGSQIRIFPFRIRFTEF